MNDAQFTVSILMDTWLIKWKSNKFIVCRLCSHYVHVPDTIVEYLRISGTKNYILLVNIYNSHDNNV